MRTIFHEFSHILHQNKLFDISFEQVTKEGYTAQWFNPQDNAALRISQSREQGFVSDYARKDRNEDFVETIAYYLILSPEDWERLLNGIDGHVAYQEAYKATKDAGLSPDERNEALKNAATMEVTDREIKDAYVAAIMAILDKAAIDGRIKLSRDLRRDFESAAKKDKFSDELWAILEPLLEGKSLDDIWNASIPVAKETKSLSQMLDSKAERQAKAAAIKVAAEAKEKISKKVTFISNYLREKWSIDLNQLRDIVQDNYKAALSARASGAGGGVTTRALEDGLTGDLRYIHTYSCDKGCYDKIDRGDH